MVAIVALLTVVGISIVVTRVAAVALEATGVSAELAFFQARSAFTGVGFTTGESETVVRHPVRRRIVLGLMLLGNAGLVTVVATLVLGFSGGSVTRLLGRFGVLLAGLALLWVVTRTRWFDRRLRALIAPVLDRWFPEVEVRDYEELLGVSGNYTIREVEVRQDSWLAGRPLGELGLTEEGVLVLGLRRPGGEYLGAPHAGLEFDPGDTLLLYGRKEALAELEGREGGAEGRREHDRAVEEAKDVQDAEQARDRQHRAEQRAHEAEERGDHAEASDAQQEAEQARRDAESAERRAARTRRDA